MISDEHIKHVGIYIGFGLVAEIGSINNHTNRLFYQPFGITLLSDFIFLRYPAPYK